MVIRFLALFMLLNVPNHLVFFLIMNEIGALNNHPKHFFNHLTQSLTKD